MSVSIAVVPSSSDVPTVGELAARLDEVLTAVARRPAVVRAFDGVDLTRRPLVEVVRQHGTRVVRQTAPTLPLSIPGPAYGWISLPGAGVGFDAWFEDGDPELHHDWVMEDCAPRAVELGTAPEFDFEAAAAVGHSWTLRLQAMQPVGVRMFAGLAAVALGQLVNGFVHSGDGGVDHDRTPTTPQRLLEWYPDWVQRDAL